MLSWRKFGNVTFAAGLETDFLVAGHRVALCQEGCSEEDGPHGATGRTLWDGAVLLAAYLREHASLVQGRRVVELGAGQGLAGVVAGLLGAQSVTLTDLPYALAGCRSTVELNRPALADQAIEVETLDWFHPPSSPPWEVVLAADVVWLVELVEPFVRALAALCPPATLVVLSYQRRGKDADEALWSALEVEGFLVKGPEPQPVLTSDRPVVQSGVDVGVYVLTRPR